MSPRRFSTQSVLAASVGIFNAKDESREVKLVKTKGGSGKLSSEVTKCWTPPYSSVPLQDKKEVLEAALNAGVNPTSEDWWR